MNVKVCGAVLVVVAAAIATVTTTTKHIIPEATHITPEASDSPARIEIQSQTGTTLTMRFFDAVNVPYDMNFTRAGVSDNWRASTTASPGILFGNPEPSYAGSALRSALGITPAQAITTFKTGIVNRPMSDVTIFKTFSGVAIALWQGKAITEIHYVGSWIEEVKDIAIQEQTPMCDANVAMCCNGAEPPLHWPPNIDGCVAALACTELHKQQACQCLTAACAHCPHPPPQPPATDPCSAADRAISELACQVGGPPCEVEPPPPPPITLQDIWDLLREILDRLQEWLDQQPQL